MGRKLVVRPSSLGCKLRMHHPPSTAARRGWVGVEVKFGEGRRNGVRCENNQRLVDRLIDRFRSRVIEQTLMCFDLIFPFHRLSDVKDRLVKSELQETCAPLSRNDKSVCRFHSPRQRSLRNSILRQPLLNA